MNYTKRLPIFCLDDAFLRQVQLKFSGGLSLRSKQTELSNSIGMNLTGLSTFDISISLNVHRHFVGITLYKGRCFVLHCLAAIVEVQEHANNVLCDF